MAKYCKHCGHLIEECICPPEEKTKKETKNRDNLNKFMENVGIPNQDEVSNSFERGKRIVPDCIIANDGEVPVRQYDIAKLRTIMKGAFAEGKLQVTNKRVIFRSSGYSLLGPNQLQYEFAIDEIAGIEIRNDHRLGVFHFWIALIMYSLLFGLFNEIFEKFADFSTFLASVVSILLFAWNLFFFVSKKGKPFLKLIFNAIAAGAIAVEAFSTKYFIIPVLNGNIHAVMGIVCVVLIIVTLIMVTFVPNLVIEIKTKSASSPIEIRRKESNGIMAFLFNMPKKEYTGYSDVMPGEDLARAKKELGAMINDINMLGDAAIEKWKENELNDRFT